MSLLFDHEGLSKIAPEAARTELRNHPCVQSLFNAAAAKLGELNLVAEQQPRWVSFGLKIQFDGFLLCGVPVLEVEFTGKARLISEKITPSVVYGYGEPNRDSGDREAMIQDFSSLGNTSISHRGSQISTFLDLSELVIPPFCQFRYWKQDSGVEVDHEVLEIQFGQKFEQLRVTGNGLRITLGALSS